MHVRIYVHTHVLHTCMCHRCAHSSAKLRCCRRCVTVTSCGAHVRRHMCRHVHRFDVVVAIPLSHVAAMSLSHVVAMSLSHVATMSLSHARAHVRTCVHVYVPLHRMHVCRWRIARYGTGTLAVSTPNRRARSRSSWSSCVAVHACTHARTHACMHTCTHARTRLGSLAEMVGKRSRVMPEPYDFSFREEEKLIYVS